MAGDDQDDPNELVRLAEAIVDGGFDFVQGSRYLRRGRRLNQPLSRTVMTLGYSVLFSIVTLRRITDATNGFKLFRTEICRDWPLRQSWLDRYELEPYLLYQAIRRPVRRRQRLTRWAMVLIGIRLWVPHSWSQRRRTRLSMPTTSWPARERCSAVAQPR